MVVSTPRWFSDFAAFWRTVLLCAAVLLAVAARVAAQTPAKLWDKTYGGNGSEGPGRMYPTADGGYVVAGSSTSGISGDKSQASRGGSDYWVIKIDAQGTKQWDRTFGGNRDDILRSLQQTADGGYSDSGVSGDRTVPSQPGLGGLFATDYWVVKLDAQGNKQWDRAYGGDDADLFEVLLQTADGGYLFGGKSYSGVSGVKSEANLGVGDYWVVKTDAQGNKQWDRTFGGNSDDALTCLHQNPDGTYLLGGYSFSPASGNRTQPSRGSNDYWLIKLDAQGNRLWERAIGGNNSDLLQSLYQTQDGGYILAGSSDSDASGEKSQGHYGNNSGYNYDYWVVKTDAAGAVQWEHTYGGAAIENANVVRPTRDGGYVVGGVSSSGVSFDKTQPNQGDGGGYDMDYWVLKISANGTKQWDRSYGGNSNDYLYSLAQTTDGGYLLSGYSGSGLSSDKTQSTAGISDFWLIRLGPVAAPVAPPVTISGDSVLCPGRSVTLVAAASPAPTAYRWNTGATTASITVAQAGLYSVTATFSTGLSSTRQFRVLANAAPPVPSFTLGADTTLCEGAALVLRAPGPASSGLSYRWSDGSSGPTLLVQQPGTYSLEISSACETRTARRTVTAASCLLIPTIITPNGDQQNEHFVVKGMGAAAWSLDVYNRWGRKVYTTAKYSNDWGSGAAPGMYYYVLRLAASARVYKGWFEVVL
ncbi:gliding motility-associated C-terminal domain-containing protein [Hymenobacter sp. 5317J-9]|uniref:gliding motility-associated C-terminal domain-containing protein n=1 Tax=Hymenobacter sp. 5317J-9 TaxID=2932250 RepID=UPI001FD63D01|nr:gliding motility-associated C-terminal domain-containing protein [Hymenobacter sp. 5317J-9]UOQ99669.1 gliding motility-associated C-terminal domain-containing protein [Hymenobacter sp. 5317J-9]